MSTTPLLVLITGANTGIGYETAKALYQSPITYKILLTGRSLQKAEAAAKKIESEIGQSPSTISTLQLDITDDKSIEAAVQKVTSDFGGLDILINNAGASFDNDVINGKLSTREAWNKSWDLNVTSTHILTEALTPLLLKSSDSRLIFLTSGTASLAETEDVEHRINIAPPAGWPKPGRTIISYRSSKTGLNMVMREWVKMLRHDPVKIWAVAPGFLATSLGGEDLKAMGAGEPSLGGTALRKIVEGERDADVGKIVRFYASPVQPW